MSLTNSKVFEDYCFQAWMIFGFSALSGLCWSCGFLYSIFVVCISINIKLSISNRYFNCKHRERQQSAVCFFACFLLFLVIQRGILMRFFRNGGRFLIAGILPGIEHDSNDVITNKDTPTYKSFLTEKRVEETGLERLKQMFTIE